MKIDTRPLQHPVFRQPGQLQDICSACRLGRTETIGMTTRHPCASNLELGAIGVGEEWFRPRIGCVVKKRFHRSGLPVASLFGPNHGSRELRWTVGTCQLQTSTHHDTAIEVNDHLGAAISAV